MFDTMTFTKVTAALCGALLILLLGKWMAKEMYHVGGHGDQQAYVIDTGESEAPAAEEEVPFAEILASADVASGEKVFKKCGACHKVVDGENGTGPHLYGVVGRDIASVDGFGSYSGTLTGLDGAWTAENLNAFLENPKGWAKGTSMSFAGLKKVDDRADVIAYLDSLDD